MKNIRRLIIVMTLAVMAMIVMTAMSFADTTFTADESNIAWTDATEKAWGIPCKYIVLSSMPEEISVTSTDYSGFTLFGDSNYYSVPLNKDTIINKGCVVESTYSGYANVIQEIGISLDDYEFYAFSPRNESCLFLIFVDKNPGGSGSTTETKVVADGQEYEFVQAESSIGVYTFHYVLFNKEPTTFSFESDEFSEVRDWGVGGNVSMPVQKENSVSVSNRSAFSSLVTELNIEEEDELYAFTQSTVQKFFFIIVKAPTPSAADITNYEQLDDYSVSVSFTGDDLDFTEVFKANWFTATLKSNDGEAIPVKVSAEVIDATHVKYTYDVDKSYENKLGKEKGTAKLTVSYKGAAEPKTFDVTLRATSYWSKYAEEPQKIAKGDKDWPEFVGYYKISTPEELAWFAGLVNGELEGVAQNNQACAFLANDIVCNDTEGWENWDQNTTGLRMWDCTIGKGGYYSDPEEIQFRGIFDGNGFTVKGLYIIPDVTRNNYQSINKQGLIASANGAVIRNLSVEESFVRAANRNAYVGGIVGDMSQTTVENCSFIGTVSNGNWAGGIVGGAESSDKIRRCFTNCKIVDSGNVQGMIAGRAYSTTMEDCYAMNGGWMIIAQASQAKLYRCYTTGNVRLAPYDLPADNLVDCFCLDGSVEDTRVRRLTEEQFTDGTLLEGLNSDAFCADDGNKNEGRPILVWQSDLYKVKKAAIKEVTYYLDPNAYSFNADDLEAAIETAIAKIEAAADQASVNSAKAAALAALDNFKSNADIAGENNAEIERLKAELARINLQIELKGAKVKVAKAQVVYNGKAQKPAVTVTGKSGAVLEEGKDYTMAYSANTKPGIAKVTVTGAGDASTEVKNATFKILPKKAALKKVKPAKKKLTVSWTKDNTVTGYEVQYSLKKNFKGAKTVKITKAGTTKKVIKKLKSGKKYFVKVRSYKKAGKVMLYGAWSKAKNAKVK
jgi:hypothetical protein